MATWIYASIGDSLSTDDYTGVEDGGAASMLFRNVSEKWPDFDGKDLVSTFPDATFHDIAVNGVSVEAIMRDQVKEVAKDTKLITVTAGLAKLISSLTRFQPGFVEKDLIRAAADDVVRRYGEVVGGLRERAKNAHIIVTGVPDPADGRNKVMHWIDWPGFTKYMKLTNEGITRIAAEHGALMADVLKPFKGHGITTTGEVRWLGTRTDVNARGAHEIRRIWWELLEKNGVV